MTIELTDEDRWQIALAKDRRYDGSFVTGVHSTGIYCRPSCPARAPLRENVRFYRSPEDARDAGLRACKRCAPDGQSREEAAVQQAVRTLRSSEAPVALAVLAEAAGYSPAHFQRLFLRQTGLSPAAFFRAIRRERANAALAHTGTVTEAIYDAGFSAPSRFYDDRKGGDAMSASVWLRGGEGVTIRWAKAETSLGSLLVAATDKGVCRLSFGEDADDLRQRFPKAELEEGGSDFAALVQRVVDAVERPGGGQDIPLDVKGTAFQEAVWTALREIPAGETRTYSQIAAAAGNPAAVRAAGSANGANNVAVLIPCHRVIRSDGSIGGYAYGTDIKRELLNRERGG